MSSETHEIYEFGPYRLDVREALLTRDGETVPLTPKVHETLVVLLRNAGRLVTREDLINTLWPDSFVSEATLSQNVWLLRKALRDGDGDVRYLETRPRRGYCFVAPVRRVEPPREDADAASSSAPSALGDTAPEAASAAAEAVAPSSAPSATAARRTLPRRLLVAAAAATLVAAFAVGVLVARARPARGRRSVAVLGIRNAGRPEFAWLPAALAEMLSTEVSAGGLLRATPTETVSRARRELALPEGDALAPDTLARVRASTGADFVVTGSCLELDGGKVRLDLKLQDARSGDTVGALAETGTESDLFGLVAKSGARLREIAGVPELTLDEARRLSRARPVSAEAARLYAEGLARLRASDPAAARALLERAVAAEPKYPLAHAALATAWSRLGYDAKARAEAKAAWELAGELGREERLVVEGAYREGTKDWPRAIAVYRTLSGWFPDDLEHGLKLAEVETRGGKARDALLTIESLRRLGSPLGDDPRLDFADAAAAGALSDPKRQLEAARRGSENAERRGASLLVARGRLEMAAALRALGNWGEAGRYAEEARVLFERAHDTAGVSRATNTLGQVAWDKGDLDGARARFENVNALAKETGDRRGEETSLNNVAAVVLDKGDLAEARKLLARSIEIGREIGDTRTVAISHANIGHALHSEGVLPDALENLERAAEMARQADDAGLETLVLVEVGAVRILRGDLAGADAAAKRAAESARKRGTRPVEATALATRSLAALERGDVAAARAHGDAALAIRRELKDESDLLTSRFELAAVRLDEGHPKEAAAEALAAADALAKAKSTDEAEALLVAADALEADGRRADAREAARRAAARAKNGGTRRLALRSLLTSSRLDDGAGAVAGLERARDGARDGGFALLELEARIALAARDASPARAARLEALASEANARGFGRLARRAADAMRGH